MKELIVFVFAYIIIGLNVHAQTNLVPNPSFELLDSCPNAFYSFTVQNWYSPTNNTPDYFNSCSGDTVGVPHNFLGLQMAKTGEAYIDVSTLILPSCPNCRDYIEVMLLDTLKSKKSYTVKFYASLADSSMYSSDGISAYISDTSITDYTSITNFHFSPQVNSLEGAPISDSSNWKLISGRYIAHGGEKFLTIGNFLPDSLTTIATSGGPNHSAAYYIDDVSVTEDSITGIGNINEDKDNSFRVFPNPTEGKVSISASERIEQLEVYNVLGIRVFYSQNPVYEIDASSPLNIDLSKQAEGIYFVRMRTKEKSVSKKILKL